MRVLVDLCKAKGVGVYLVGGAVRDLLLDFEAEINDLDIFIEQEPQQVQVLLEEAKKTVGDLHPDEKHPYRYDILHGANVGERLKRFDITVNAVAWDLHNQVIVDPLEKALGDIERRVIRPVNLLLYLTDFKGQLRSIRFALSRNLTIDDELLGAMAKNSALYGLSDPVHRSKCFAEMLRMFTLGRSEEALMFLHKTGFLVQILPEAAPGLASDPDAFISQIVADRKEKEAGLSASEMENYQLKKQMVFPADLQSDDLTYHLVVSAQALECFKTLYAHSLSALLDLNKNALSAHVFSDQVLEQIRKNAIQNVLTRLKVWPALQGVVALALQSE